MGTKRLKKHVLLHAESHSIVQDYHSQCIMKSPSENISAKYINQAMKYSVNKYQNCFSNNSMGQLVPIDDMKNTPNYIKIAQMGNSRLQQIEW